MAVKKKIPHKADRDFPDFTRLSRYMDELKLDPLIDVNGWTVSVWGGGLVKTLTWSCDTAQEVRERMTEAAEACPRSKVTVRATVNITAEVTEDFLNRNAVMED